ncbi:hypothetical protein LTR62_001331 [Meristemomyces frigidus]|uniref:CHAT domain-containing protein n=1 Tax=Meristemomyces frigidus TaxID=1508187 RepID=A0AAN7T9E5_9PEZI|nr:hypothetical protein LTR62_001331 [Meristemomyces frigidus]
MVPCGLRRVELEGIDMDVVLRYRNLFLKVVDAKVLESHFAWAGKMFENIMTFLWKKVASPIMDAIASAPSQRRGLKKPRVFWLSTSLTSFFPIHAAGDYDDPQPGRFVHDRVVSSYTPSVQVLKHMRTLFDKFEGTASHTGDTEALLVGMRSTPGRTDLRADVELDVIRASLPSTMSNEPLMEPKSDQVLLKLSTCTLVHFACHGVSNGEDPSLSKLLLQDWKRNPFTVRKLISAKVHNCRLAYLSACETMSVKDARTHDEGIHLAGGFHMAGIPQVISTSWSVDDDVSAAVASMFYSFLDNGEDQLDFKGAAIALDNVVQILRDQGVHALLWGAYVHSGV